MADTAEKLGGSEAKPVGDGQVGDAENKSGEETLPQFTQQDIDNAVRGRQARSDRQHGKTDDEHRVTTERLLRSEEENKILKLAVDQTKAPEAPKPDDFDGDATDPEFLRKQGEYNAHQIKMQVTEQVAAAKKEIADAGAANALERDVILKRDQHYNRVRGMGEGAQSYIKREAAAEIILGENNTNQIINIFPNSEEVLSVLGAENNKTEAQRIASLLNGSQLEIARGLADIGKLMATPEGKSKAQPPDPYEDIQGDTPSRKESPYLKGAKFE